MKIYNIYPSFTLAEIMVVLVISSIVITMAVDVLVLVQKQFTKTQNLVHHKIEIQLLENALWQDSSRSNVMIYNDEKQKLHCMNGVDTVQYHFTDKYILRNKDTLNVSIIEKQFYLHAKKVKTGVVDALELKILKQFLFIYKKNNASFYMNHHEI